MNKKNETAVFASLTDFLDFVASLAHVTLSELREKIRRGGGELSEEYSISVDTRNRRLLLYNRKRRLVAVYVCCGD